MWRLCFDRELSIAVRSRPLNNVIGLPHRADLRSSFGARTAVHFNALPSALDIVPSRCLPLSVASNFEVGFAPLILRRQLKFEMSVRELDGLDRPLTPGPPDESSCEFARRRV